MKCKLFLTFDHELPLGGLKTSYIKALFEPTERLLKLAEKINVKINLFTDILCAYRFRDWDYEGFYKPFTEQLTKSFSLGHDVQLHLHPHWLTSQYNGKTYIPSRDFSFDSFLEKKNFTIEKIIQTGIDLLSKEIQNIHSEYKCIAFRAGGYYIPLNVSSLVFQTLYSEGIRFDSSICKDYFFISEFSEVDYRNMPIEPNWYIGTNGNFRENNNTGVLEIPIAGLPKSFFELPTLLKMKIYSKRSPQNHGIQIHKNSSKKFTKGLKQLFSARMLNFDNYTYSKEFLLKILDKNLEKYCNCEEIMLCAIGHPKSMGDYNFNLFSDFVNEVRRKYGETVEFYTYSKLYNEKYFN